MSLMIPVQAVNTPGALPSCQCQTPCHISCHCQTLCHTSCQYVNAEFSSSDVSRKGKDLGRMRVGGDVGREQRDEKDTLL